MSSSVVLQFEIEIRIACLPCQIVPPAQQVPSAWTRAITSRVIASASRSPEPSNWTSTWLSTTSFRTFTPGAADS